MEDKVENRDFEKELVRLLNRHSQENMSETPDYILATYLLGCFAAFNYAVRSREAWYGRPIEEREYILDKEREC